VPSLLFSLYDGLSWMSLLMLAYGVPFGAIAGTAFWALAVSGLPVDTMRSKQRLERP
jgi:hypothetical protein